MSVSVERVSTDSSFTDEDQINHDNIKTTKEAIIIPPIPTDPIAGLIMCSGLPIFHFVFGLMALRVYPWNISTIKCYGMKDIGFVEPYDFEEIDG